MPLKSTTLAVLFLTISLVAAQGFRGLNDTAGFYSCTRGRGYTGALHLTGIATASECLQRCRSASDCYAIYYSGYPGWSDSCFLFYIHVVSNKLWNTVDLYGLLCDKCRPGFYCPSGEAIACGANMTSPNGATSASQCVCSAGFITTAQGCVECPPGTLCPGNGIAPNPCPSGNFCPTAAAAIPCPVDTVSSANSTFCSPCPVGQSTATLTGQLMCSPAPVILLTTGSIRNEAAGDPKTGSTIASWNGFTAMSDNNSWPLLTAGPRSQAWYVSIRNTQQTPIQQYLSGGPLSLRPTTNRGVTILCLIRLSGSGGSYERVLDVNSGTASWFILTRVWMSSSIAFQTRDGTGYRNITAVVAQDTWTVIGVRIAPAIDPALWSASMIMNGNAQGTSSMTALPDTTYIDAWIGRSAYGADAMANFDLAYLGVWDTWLLDGQYSQIQNRLLTMRTFLNGNAASVATVEPSPVPPVLSFRSIICSAGFFGTQNGCVQCPKNMYCAGTSAPAVSCPNGMITQSTGSTASSACICPAGTYLSNGMCSACPLNSYCPAGSIAPVSCNGQISIGEAATRALTQTGIHNTCNGGVETCTSFSAPNGLVVSADSIDADLWTLFDGQADTTWRSRQAVYSNTEIAAGDFYARGAPAIMRIEAPFLISMRSYTFQAHTVNNGEAPSNWQVEGWNGTRWINVDTRQSLNWALAEQRTFTLASTAFYRAYRFIFWANNRQFAGASSKIGLGEMSARFDTELGARTALPGQTNAAACLNRAGYFTVGQLSEQCPPNFYCPAGSLAPIPCGNNSITDGPGAMSTAECLCSAGYFGFNGACTICSTGQFCPRGSRQPRMCNAATTFPASDDMLIQEATLRQTVAGLIPSMQPDRFGVPVFSYTSGYNATVNSIDLNWFLSIHMALDNRNATTYGSAHQLVSFSQTLPASTVPVIIRIDAPGPQVLSSFLFRAREEYYNTAPTRFDLEGSNNGAAWSLIQSYASTAWSAGESRSFAVTSSNSFRSFRWRITACNTDAFAGACVIQITRMQVSFAALPSLTTAGPGASSYDQCGCPLGMYGPVHACQSCTLGNNCPFGTLTPLSCDQNSNAATGVSACQCKPGYYGGQNGTCLECPMDAYCPGSTASPLTCPNNTMTLSRLRTGVEDCKCALAGSYGDGTCTACPVNSTCAGNGTLPAPCPANSMTTASGSAQVFDCVCLAGYQRVNNTCVACPLNTFCAFGSAPVGCPSDRQTLSSGSTRYADCVCRPGSHDVAGTCTACPLNSYCPLNSGPIACPKNSVTTSTSSQQASDCVCAIGYQRVSGNCVECLPNTYCPFGVPPVFCPADRQTASNGSTRSTDCVCRPGNYSVGGTCTACPQNHYCPLNTGPLPCPDKSMTTSTGSIRVSDCVCVAGHHRVNGSNQCTACPLNLYCPTGQEPVECFKGGVTIATGQVSVIDCVCPEGMQLESDSTGCRPCPAGSYQSTPSRAKCSLCPGENVLCHSCTAQNSTMCAQCGFVTGKQCSGLVEMNGVFGLDPNTTWLLGLALVATAVIVALINFCAIIAGRKKPKPQPEMVSFYAPGQRMHRMP